MATTTAAAVATAGVAGAAAPNGAAIFFGARSTFGVLLGLLLLGVRVPLRSAEEKEEERALLGGASTVESTAGEGATVAVAGAGAGVGGGGGTASRRWDHTAIGAYFASVLAYSFTLSWLSQVWEDTSDVSPSEHAHGNSLAMSAIERDSIEDFWAKWRLTGPPPTFGLLFHFFYLLPLFALHGYKTRFMPSLYIGRAFLASCCVVCAAQAAILLNALGDKRSNHTSRKVHHCLMLAVCVAAALSAASAAFCFALRPRPRDCMAGSMARGGNADLWH